MRIYSGHDPEPAALCLIRVSMAAAMLVAHPPPVVVLSDAGDLVIADPAVALSFDLSTSGDRPLPAVGDEAILVLDETGMVLVASDGSPLSSPSQ